VVGVEGRRRIGQDRPVNAPVHREPDTSEWVVDGQPIEDEALRARLRESLTRAAEVVDGLLPPREADVCAFAAAERALDRAAERVAEALEGQHDIERTRTLARLAVRLAALQRDVGEASLRYRTAAFARVQEALARLREARSTEQILRAMAAEVQHLGFPRVIVSRVEDGTWIPFICVIDGDPEWADVITRAGQEDPQPLDHMILESEMVRRRMPMLVRDVQTDPRAHRPIADASFSRSYVTAPLMPDGRVIGFIHADCYTSRRNVDEFDRDLLWLFAEGAGYAFVRTLLLERLEHMRDSVRGATEAIGSTVDGVVTAEVELAQLERRTAAVTRSATSRLIGADARLQSVLTRREIEVAKLLATGQTNAEIARRLFVSEATVKTHVSNVLKKLGAANRAQAASIVMHLTRPAEG
jgi:DNA-binding CsgD family transcriptional regulator